MADLPTNFKCQQCGAGIRIGRHYCPNCGAKVDVNFDEIEKSVEFDKAADTGDKIGAWARTGVTLMLVVGVVVFAVKDCYSEREFPSDPNDFVLPLPPNVQGAVKMDPQAIDADYALRRPDRQESGTNPWAFAYRLSEDYRNQSIVDRGGKVSDVKQIINNGLSMLAGEQQADGSFPVRHFSAKNLNRKKQWYPEDWQGYLDAGIKNDVTPVGATALAALCFLGNGDLDIPQSTGLDRNKKIPGKAIKWLLSQQDKDTGAFGAKNAHWCNNHAQATLALVEYTGLTRDKDRTRSRTIQALNFLLTFADANGGFRYLDDPQFQPNLEATTWALMALAGAREAGMLEDLDQTKLTAIYNNNTKFLAGLRTTKGAVAFDPNQLAQSGQVRAWMGMYLSSVMMLSGNDLGKPKEDVIKAFIKPTYNSVWPQPWDMNASGANVVMFNRAAELRPNDYFFATHALRQVGGPEWLAWQDALVTTLKAWQDPNDYSFRANDELARDRGLVWSTTMNLLALESYYRQP